MVEGTNAGKDQLCCATGDSGICSDDWLYAQLLQHIGNRSKISHAVIDDGDRLLHAKLLFESAGRFVYERKIVLAV